MPPAVTFIRITPVKPNIQPMIFLGVSFSILNKRLAISIAAKVVSELTTAELTPVV